MESGKRRPQRDVVYTPYPYAKKIIEYFNPHGSILDPCKGGGAFYNQFTNIDKDWCEILDGKDFLQYDKTVDWIMTNPPWSSKIYRAVAQHSFKLATNVVFLVRLHNALGTYARHNDYLQYNHKLKEIVMVNWPIEWGSEGFILGVFHWQKDYVGDIKLNTSILNPVPNNFDKFFNYDTAINT